MAVVCKATWIRPLDIKPDKTAPYDTEILAYALYEMRGGNRGQITE
jgi:hypothetical protein